MKHRAKSRERLHITVALLTHDFYMPSSQVAEKLGLSMRHARRYIVIAREHINEAKRLSPKAPPERRKAPRGPATYPIPVFLNL